MFLNQTLLALGAIAGQCPKCGGARKVASNEHLALCRRCEHGAACPPALAAIKEGKGDFPTRCRQCSECGHIEPIEAPVMDWKLRAWMARG